MIDNQVMINSKKKGNHGENLFANWLSDNGIKAWKDSMSGGGNREKGDVGNNIDFTFEVKTVKKVNLPAYWKQTKISAEKHHNRPCLVIHLDGMPKDSWIMIMDNWDWLDIIMGENKIDIKYENTNLKWKAKRAKEAINEFLKELNK